MSDSMRRTVSASLLGPVAALAMTAALLLPAAVSDRARSRLVSDGVVLPGEDASPAAPHEPCPDAATPEPDPTLEPEPAPTLEPAPRNRPISLTVPDKAAAPAGYPVFGIDVSSHQGWIDWSWVASSGAKFAYAKATEGTGFLDPYFNYNYHAAKRNGLYAGAYHFARPDVSGGRAQANYFLDRAQFANDGRTLPPMLDIEWPWTGSSAPFPCYARSRWQLGNWIADFVARVRERTGRPTMIYSNINWWNPCVGDNPSFGDHPLFIARYAGNPGSLMAGWRDWTLWQYSSSGRLPGDQDVFNGNRAALQRLAQGR
jgi:GH25 family lysozyme M1 (1,4-beta-N-acetylmuramidase)